MKKIEKLVRDDKIAPVLVTRCIERWNIHPGQALRDIERTRAEHMAGAAICGFLVIVLGLVFCWMRDTSPYMSLNSALGLGAVIGILATCCLWFIHDLTCPMEGNLHAFLSDVEWLYQVLQQSGSDAEDILRSSVSLRDFVESTLIKKARERLQQDRATQDTVFAPFASRFKSLGLTKEYAWYFSQALRNSDCAEQ